MLLEVDDINVHYGKIAALKGISLRVDEGEIVTLIGANGAGKTTHAQDHLRAAAVDERVDPVQGRDISRVPGHKRVVLGIGQSPEGRGISPHDGAGEPADGGVARNDDVSKDWPRSTSSSRAGRGKSQFGGTMVRR